MRADRSTVLVDHENIGLRSPLSDLPLRKWLRVALAGHKAVVQLDEIRPGRSLVTLYFQLAAHLFATPDYISARFCVHALVNSVSAFGQVQTSGSDKPVAHQIGSLGWSYRRLAHADYLKDPDPAG